MAQDLSANLRELSVIASVVPLSVIKLLEVSDRSKVLAAAERYQLFKEGKIQDIWYQRKIVKDACRRTSGSYAYQLPPGAGKTYPSAEISARFQRYGKTIYVCPNSAAMGDERSGIIQKFHQMYHAKGVRSRIGRVNETTKLNDVHFFTPRGLLGLQKLHRKLFEQIIEQTALLIVDEAHHFPIESDGRHRIFGEIPKFAKKFFLNKKKKLLAFTATYGRLDGRLPIASRPDFRLTVQDVVNEGRCPEVHGLQIFLPFRCPKAQALVSDVDLRLKGRDYRSYWRMVGGCILETYRRNTVPFAVFVRLKKEAEYLAKIFNQSSGLGERGIGVLTADTSMPERLRIIERVNKGQMAGYVTCGVGEEAIDIPRLEVIHFVKRTTSENKIMQAVGRALRVSEGKRRTLFVDYQVMKESVIRACNGIFLYARACGVSQEEIKKRTNGGAIVAVEGAETAILPGESTFGEMEALVVRQLQLERSPAERRKEGMFRYASTGAERPSDNKLGQFEGEDFVQMGRLFYRLNNPKAKEYDPDFLKRIHDIPNVHPSWKGLVKDRMQEREETLLAMAAAGESRPKWKGPQHTLAFSLSAWTSKPDPKYKPEFDAKIRVLSPRWFRPLHEREMRVLGDLGVGEVVSEFQARVEDLCTPPLEGHWLNTRLFVDAGSTYAGSERSGIEDAVLAALKKGQFPEGDDLHAVESYFVIGQTVANVELRKGKWEKREVPLVWKYADLKDGLRDYTNRDSVGPFLRYHSSFSFHVKLQYPDCPYVQSLWRRDHGDLGLKHWEKWLKRKELAYFQKFDELSQDERERMTVWFTLIDNEFAREVDSFYYKNTTNVDGQYGAFERPDQAEAADKIKDLIPKHWLRMNHDRNLWPNYYELEIQSVYKGLNCLDERALIECGGYSAVYNGITYVATFHEMGSPLRPECLEAVKRYPLGRSLSDLETRCLRIAGVVNDKHFLNPKGRESLIAQQDELRRLGVSV